jgi:hypothetical protein
MATRAVIIVPSQGRDAVAFEGVGVSVDKKVYDGKAVVVRTTVTTDVDGSLGVTFSGRRGKAFSWGDVSELTSVVTISHGAPCDGPNLDYGAGGENQPWASPGECAEGLSEGGRAFWRSMAVVLKATGKIILVGCYMGMYSYAKSVAAVTGRTVYAADDAFAAAHGATAVKHLKAIERGVVIQPMKRFDPGS